MTNIPERIEQMLAAGLIVRSETLIVPGIGFRQWIKARHDLLKHGTSYRDDENYFYRWCSNERWEQLKIEKLIPNDFGVINCPALLNTDKNSGYIIQVRNLSHLQELNLGSDHYYPFENVKCVFRWSDDKSDYILES